MQKTENYSFNKPDADDFYNVEDFNANMDIIDEKLKEIEEAAKSNSVTKTDLGLDKVDNTADSEKSVKYAATAGSANTATNADYATSAGTANAVAWGNVIEKPSSFTPAEHKQAASTITAGTLGGKVVANATAAATVSEKQVRNIYAGTSDMTAGTTALPSGDIYAMYE